VSTKGQKKRNEKTNSKSSNSGQYKNPPKVHKGQWEQRINLQITQTQHNVAWGERTPRKVKFGTWSGNNGLQLGGKGPGRKRSCWSGKTGRKKDQTTTQKNLVVWSLSGQGQGKRKKKVSKEKKQNPVKWYARTGHMSGEKS